MSKRNAPVVIEMDGVDVEPAMAAPVSEPEMDAPKGQAIQTLAILAARPPSLLWRFFWSLLIGLSGTYLSIAAWDFVTDMTARNILLGQAVSIALGLFLLVLFGLGLRELLALNRLATVDKLRQAAIHAAKSNDLKQAMALSDRLTRFYRGREDLRWALGNLAEQKQTLLDGDALLMATERELMVPLDAAARREIEASARQVATVTAIVPLALADVAVALFANMRMVRRIAEIYGGRAGSFGSWRLLKTVLLHLAATGAVAIGDDLISSVMGGGLASKLSRRFGEGVVNGALTARVGVAAMEVCRPMPFQAITKPRVTSLVKNALTGLFSKT